MTKIARLTISEHVGSGYPKPWCDLAAGRIKKRLGDAAGLTGFGVNLTVLPPGNWSSQRHWHSHEDEFVYVLEGELVLVTDAGEETIGAGECAGFKAGVADGHCFVNRSDRPAVYLEVGGRDGRDHCHYPDIDLDLPPAGADGHVFRHKDGKPY